jgi:hypothetical protein
LSLTKDWGRQVSTQVKKGSLVAALFVWPLIGNAFSIIASDR